MLHDRQLLKEFITTFVLSMSHLSNEIFTFKTIIPEEMPIVKLTSSIYGYIIKYRLTPLIKKRLDAISAGVDGIPFFQYKVFALFQIKCQAH